MLLSLGAPVVAVSFVAGAIAAATAPVAGDLDVRFGTRGVAVTNVPGNLDSYAREVLAQRDGKVILVGSSQADSSTPGEVVLSRLLPSGRADPSYGIAGIAQLLAGGGAAAAAMQPDGKVVAAGAIDVPGGQDALIARIDTSGNLDASFGSGGRVETDFIPGDSADLDYVLAVAIQEDGKILAVGQANGSREDPVRLALARYTADGQLDPAFGLGGIVTLEIPDLEVAQAVVIQRDGKILVGGGAFRVARFTADGGLDRSWGTGGVASGPALRGGAELRALLLQNDGRVVAVGHTEIGEQHILVARYGSDGTLDPSFGAGGVARFGYADGEPYVGAYAATLQPDGKIAVAGGNGGDVMFARLTASGHLDRSFGGTGVVTVARPGGDYASGLAFDGRSLIAAGDTRVNPLKDGSSMIAERVAAAGRAGTTYSSLRAEPGAATTRLKWRTTREVALKGFYIAVGDGFGAPLRRLTGPLIDARGSSTSGASYTAVVRRTRPPSGLTPELYWVVEVGADGVRRFHGPLAAPGA